MSIDEQIEAAWIEYVNDMDEDVRNTVAFHSDVFDAGYRAALRWLFTEIKPEELKHRETYWCLTPDGWIVLKWLSGMQWWDSHKEKAYKSNQVSKILDDAMFPSPAEVFGEEVGK